MMVRLFSRDAVAKSPCTCGSLPGIYMGVILHPFVLCGIALGILACRTLDNNELFMKRCADTFEDDRGLVIPITDEDLKRALTDFPKRGVNALEQILQEKYEQIVFMK